MRFAPIIPALTITAPPPGGERPSVLAFSMAKAGSTLLSNILAKLSPHLGLTYFSISNWLFANNVSANQRPGKIGNVFCPLGYCYGGFRQFPAFPVPLLGSAKIIFLVRDPRDMITSLYFSLLQSHSIPETEGVGGAKADMLKVRARLSHIDIDKYAKASTRSYMRMFEGYIAQGFHWRRNVATYRYEDVIFDKRGWIADICSWFEGTVPATVIDQIAATVDVVVDGERPQEHIRQVNPGNHRKHLKPETINAINQTLGEYMAIYGYQ